MKLLIKQALILDSNSESHLQKKDILIENGIFTKIDNQLSETVDQIIAGENLYLSTGFIDIFSNFNDPGFEQKETLKTGALAAQKGGFTTVFVVPNTNPCTDSKTNIEYIKNGSGYLPVQILPIGAVTTATEGKTLAEMIEMRDAGAAAFSDGTHPVQQAGLLLKALQYVKTFDGTIIQVPIDISLSVNGFVNEGILSTQLGLPGIPAIAEEMMVARDIELCLYADSKLHCTGISTARSLELIKAAKAKNIKVSCSVTPYHLLLNEEEIGNYNTNAKVNPPLRTKQDMLAMQQGLLDGTIDCIAAHHFPQELDAKQCEFAYAQYGMSSIEQCFQAVASIPGITPEKIFNVLSKNCKSIFGLPDNSIAVGKPAIASLFQLGTEQNIEEKNMRSKGKNSAFIGKKLQGKIMATINHTHTYIAE